MSGGVDSSVAAALLKKQGFRVIGVFMKPWQPDGVECLWKKDREDALRVASKLEIPLLTWDFSKEYKKLVTDYMIREYRDGRTPNPDVMCNKEIKFGLFLKKAVKHGADFIATGHYIKIKNVKIKMQNDNLKFKIIYKLFQAKDKNKDQSYFLWTLTPRELKHCLFPIGDYTKPEVRKMAQKFGLPTADKKDSQGICFVGPLDIKRFLKKYIRPRSGKIINMQNEVIGTHDGIYYYTVGQRHGLDLGKRTVEARPYYIISKNIKTGVIKVGDEKDLFSNKTRLTYINWVSKKIKLPSSLEVKIRYRTSSEKATLHKNGSLIFDRPIRAITPGQSAVFYKNGQLLGGGIIV